MQYQRCTVLVIPCHKRGTQFLYSRKIQSYSTTYNEIEVELWMHSNHRVLLMIIQILLFGAHLPLLILTVPRPPYQFLTPTTRYRISLAQVLFRTDKYVLNIACLKHFLCQTYPLYFSPKYYIVSFWTSFQGCWSTSRSFWSWLTRAVWLNSPILEESTKPNNSHFRPKSSSEPHIWHQLSFLSLVTSFFTGIYL